MGAACACQRSASVETVGDHPKTGVVSSDGELGQVASPTQELESFASVSGNDHELFVERLKLHFERGSPALRSQPLKPSRCYRSLSPSAVAPNPSYRIERSEDADEQPHVPRNEDDSSPRSELSSRCPPSMPSYAAAVERSNSENPYYVEDGREDSHASDSEVAAEGVSVERLASPPQPGAAYRRLTDSAVLRALRSRHSSDSPRSHSYSWRLN